jgi:hypothetical protein
MASNTTGRPIESAMNIPLYVSALIFPNGAGTPTYSSVGGAVTSVARTAAGVFSVVLTEQYGRLQGHSVSARTAALGTACAGKLGPIVQNTDGTTTVTVWAVAADLVTGVDLTADANASISLELMFEDGEAT